MSTVIDPILPGEGVAPPQHHPLLVLLCAATGGIVMDRYLPHALTSWWLAAAASLIAWMMLRRLRWRWLALAALLSGYVLAFAGWHHACWQLYSADEIGNRATLDVRPICVEATALDNVRWRPAPHDDPLRVIPQGDSCRLRVALDAVRDGDDWQPATGRATLTIDGHLLGVRAGDRVRVLALIHRTPPAQNPGEYDAAYHERVDRQLVRLSAVSPDCVTRIAAGSPYHHRRWLSQLRDACNEQLWRQIDPERAGLAAGLLVGSREQIETAQTQQFFLTGTVHLLAISGVHLGILATGFWFVMRTGVLGRRSAIGAAMIFVFVYTLLADAEPPILRSAILVFVICIGRWLGRPTPPMNALAAGGLVVLVYNPTEFFEVGTQLSFLAVATLIYCGPLLIPKRTADPLRRLIEESRPRWWRWSRWWASYVWRLWLTGTCIWLVAVPLTLYRFNVLSVSALLLNVLLWIPITGALYFGFAALTIGWLFPPGGALLGWLCDGCLWIVASTIQWGEGLPLSYFWLPGPALWWVIGFYVGLAAYVALLRWRPRWYWCMVMLVLWTAIGHATSERSPLNVASQRDEQLRCTFVAVGHGTSCLVEYPNGYVMLYDAGHMGTPQGGARSISAVLWSRGITRLDAVVISHADADHYNCLPELLGRFQIGAVYVSPVMFHREPEGVQVLRAAIEKRNVPLRVIHGGQRLSVGPDVHCEVLHPPRRGVIGSDNANSIVLALTYAGKRVLLPGDLERNGLVDLLAEEPLPCDVVMCPHHGSASSNPLGFAQWSSPRFVVISGARARDATEVIDAYRSYGAEVLHTAHDGALQFTLCSDGQLKIHSWHDDQWHERRHREGR
jgi:competence protein ComEC